MTNRNKQSREIFPMEHCGSMAASHSEPMELDLKGFRRARGMSQEALASAFGYEQGMMSKIESGAKNVSWKKLQEAARALEITPAAFFNFDDEPEAYRPATSQGAAALDVGGMSAQLVNDSEIGVEFELGDAGTARFLLPREKAADLSAWLSDLSREARKRSTPSHPSATS